MAQLGGCDQACVDVLQRADRKAFADALARRDRDLGLPAPGPRLAALAYFGGAAADIGTSVAGGHCYEANPAWAWADRQPAVMASASAGAAVAVFYVVTRVARDHPRIRDGLLYGLGAARGAVALNNARVCF